ncbi:hypothetical protein Tco_0858852 [Tanacetum coccineum]|uniref:Uncharacterized protein n=1 Tax=Tanacetum coccineum TaxID=301880 RepID=A0ABQ5BAG9_9ASTR
MVAGKQILISEETIRADLLFDDAHGVENSYPKASYLGLAQDIGYESRHKSKVSISPDDYNGMLGHNFKWRARDAQGTPAQSAAQASISQGTAEVQGTDNSQGTAEVQGIAEVQGTTRRPVRRLKTNLSQAKLIRISRPKLKTSPKSGRNHGQTSPFWVESQHLKKQKRRRKKHKKKVSTAKLGRNKEEGTLSEEHYVQDDYTADPFFEDIVDKDAAVTPVLERKSDGLQKSILREKGY